MIKQQNYAKTNKYSTKNTLTDFLNRNFWKLKLLKRLNRDRQNYTFIKTII